MGYREMRTVEPRRLGCGQASSVLALSRRGARVEEGEASRQAQVCSPARREVQTICAGPGLEHGLRSGQRQNGTRFRLLTIVDVYHALGDGDRV